MSVPTGEMVNENYEPSDNDEQVLDAMKNGRESGQPWGRANPRYLIDETRLDKGNVEFSLRSLRDAGWLERVSRGLYELNEDPREDDNEQDRDLEQTLENVDLALERIDMAFERGDPDAARSALEEAQEAISDGDSDDAG